MMHCLLYNSCVRLYLFFFSFLYNAMPTCTWACHHFESQLAHELATIRELAFIHTSSDTQLPTYFLNNSTYFVIVLFQSKYYVSMHVYSLQYFSFPKDFLGFDVLLRIFSGKHCSHA